MTPPAAPAVLSARPFWLWLAAFAALHGACAWFAAAGPLPVLPAAGIAIGGAIRFGAPFVLGVFVAAGAIGLAAGNAVWPAMTLSAAHALAAAVAILLQPAAAAPNAPGPRATLARQARSALAPAALFALVLAAAWPADEAMHQALGFLAGALALRGLVEHPLPPRTAAAIVPASAIGAWAVLAAGHATGLAAVGVAGGIAALAITAVLVPRSVHRAILAGAGPGIAAAGGLVPGAASWQAAAVVALVVLALDLLAAVRQHWEERLAEAEDRIVRRTSRIRYLLRERDEVTALAVHDLQSPLQAIGGLQKTLLHILDTGRADPGPMRAALAAAIETTDRLSDSIGSVLSASRPHLGGAADATRLATLVEHVLAAHRLGLGTAELEVTREVPGDLCVADAEDVKDILDVLVDNALCHAGSPGRIAITAFRMPDRPIVAIRVDDDGPGLAEHRARKLFAAPGAARAAGSRQGMGLFLAYRRCKALGGSLRYHRSRWGGARFEILLPAEGQGDRAAPG